MAINTKMFLAPEIERREYLRKLRKPFVVGDHIAFSNGHVVAFVPVSESDIVALQAKENSPHELVIVSCGGLLNDIENSKKWEALPPVVFPESKPCHACEGRGRVAIEQCDCCEGVGVVERHIDCEECDGWGEIFVPSDSPEDGYCPVCVGNGHLYDDEEYIEIGGMFVAPRYLEFIVHEPDLLFFTNPERHMLFFKQTMVDRCGVIMGLDPAKCAKKAAA